MNEANYLDSAIKQFEYYKTLGEKTFDQIEESDLFWQFNDESNSISVIVNHLWGNMLSRWTDFLESDGEKDWRNRDQEFESVITSRDELHKKWEEGWSCLFGALDSITQANFQSHVFIRNQKHTLFEAINRQMMHYAYHVGQIVYIGRMIAGEKWNSLSIPKGESSSFNAKKFSKGQHDGHFTDDIK